MDIAFDMRMLSKCYASNTIYKCPATATVHNLLCFAVFSLFNRYRKNCKKKAKCSCDRYDTLNLMHCRNALTCSHISVFIPSNPHTVPDLKLQLHLWPRAWKRSLLPQKSGNACMSLLCPK